MIPAPPGATFRYFEDPRNLAEITPPWLGFGIATIEGLPLAAGTRIDYRIRWLGLPLRWRTLIAEYESGHRFVDVQTSGPYRFWRHEHVFEDRQGQTLMLDRVRYELPLGALGRIVHTLLVARQLREIFGYRAARIGEIFAEEAG